MKKGKRKMSDQEFSHLRGLGAYLRRVEKEKSKKLALEPWLARAVKELKADPYFAGHDVEAEAREVQAMINAMTPAQRKRLAQA